MKKILTILYTLFLLIFINAQYRSGADATVGNTNVENGSAGISYNIYNLENGSIKLPITLYYSGSRGIKVNEISSWIGLGWELSAGGCITRVVQGYPDDEYKGKDKKEGILFNNNLLSAESLNLSILDLNEINNIIKKDYESDIFYIKIYNINAMFFFDKDKNIICSNKNLKITYSQEITGKLSSFTVVDEEGLSYVFDKVGSITETTKFENAKIELENKEDVTRSYNSSWFLTKVLDIYGNYVNINYNSEKREYFINKIEKKNIQKQNVEATINDYDYVGGTNIVENNYNIASIITSKGEEIKFNTSDRLDLTGGKRLYNININNKTNYDFIQNYFISSGGSGKEYYRLRLDKINLNKKYYLEFLYDGKLLPKRQSTEQDFWGYYNGNGAKSLIPKVYIDESSTKNKSFVNYGYDNFNESNYIVLDGADRKSNMNTEACILKQINNQYGGSTEFIYELNDFIYEGKKITGNGLRIKNIKYKDASNSYKTNYTYNDNTSTSGTVISVPKFSYVLTQAGIRYIKDSRLYYEFQEKKYLVTSAAASGVQFNDQGSSNWTNYEKYYITTQVFSSNVNNIFNDFTVNYARVNETSDFFKGTIVKYFDTPKSIDNYSSPTKGYVSFLGSNFFKDYTTDPDVNGIPFKPSTMTNNNNLILKKIEKFDINSSIVGGTEWFYNEKDNTSKILQLKYFTSMIMNPYFLTIGGSPYIQGGGIMTKYILFDNKINLLSYIENKDYLNTKQYNNKKYYEYNSRNYLSKESWTDSEGNTYEKKIKYAYDYNFIGIPTAGSPQEAIQYMNDKNMFALPIETIVFRNNKIISGDISIYKKTGNSINLVEKKSLEIDNLNTPYQATSVNATNFTIDSRYVGQEFYDLYDSNGNLLQKHTLNGLYTSFIYGYNKKYLIATLSNMQYNNIPSSTIQSLTSTTDETTLKLLLGQLRTQFTESGIITSTYVDFVGKSSDTDEKGISTFYEYDDMNRMIRVKNADGKILKETKYKFAFD